MVARKRSDPNLGNHRREKGAAVNADGFGLIGLVVDYAMIIAFSLGAMILFAYLWKKGRLDFDEEAKHQMMEEE